MLQIYVCSVDMCKNCKHYQRARSAKTMRIVPTLPLSRCRAKHSTLVTVPELAACTRTVHTVARPHARHTRASSPVLSLHASWTHSWMSNQGHIWPIRARTKLVSKPQLSTHMAPKGPFHDALEVHGGAPTRVPCPLLPTSLLGVAIRRTTFPMDVTNQRSDHDPLIFSIRHCHGCIPTAPHGIILFRVTLPR
jgi:hypothetical protein